MAHLADTPDMIAERLARQIVRSHRAIVALGLVPRHLRGRFERAVTERISGLGLTSEAVARVTLPDDASLVGQANRRRDLLLHEVRLILLTAPDEVGLRALKREGVDLLSAVDLTFEVKAPSSDRRRLMRQIRTFSLGHDTKDDLGPLLGAPRVGSERALGEPRDGEDAYVPLVTPAWPGTGIDLSEVVEPGPRGFFLTGPSGAGKTTFLRNLVRAYGNNEDDDFGEDPLGVGVRVPILIHATEMARAWQQGRSTLSLPEVIGRWLVERGVADGDALGEDLDGLLVLMDGLDRVDIGTQRQIIDGVLDLLRSGNTAVVLAAEPRARSRLSDAQDAALVHLQVGLPSVRQGQRLLRGALHDGGILEDSAVEAIWQGLYARGLTTTPLHLVLSAVYQDRLDVPPSAGSLVGDLIEDEIRRSLRRRRRSPASHEPAGLVECLGTLALWLFEHQRRDVSLSELPEVLAASRRSEPEVENHLGALRGLLTDKPAFMRPSGQDRWAFAHDGFADWFAGHACASDGRRWPGRHRDDISGGVMSVEWPEILRFYVAALARLGGYHRNALAELGEQLAECEPSVRAVQMLAAVLRENPDFPRSTHTRLVDRLLDLCLVQAWPAQSRPAITCAIAGFCPPMGALRDGSGLGQRLADLIGGGAFPWRSDQAELVAQLGPVLRAYGFDPTPFIEALVQSPDHGLALAGWKNRISLADDEVRETVVEAALDAMPGLSRRVLDPAPI